MFRLDGVNAGSYFYLPLIEFLTGKRVV